MEKVEKRYVLPSIYNEFIRYASGLVSTAGELRCKYPPCCGRSLRATPPTEGLQFTGKRELYFVLFHVICVFRGSSRVF